MNTLTLLATAHIQSFLFDRASRLRESIGASCLVRKVFKRFEGANEKIYIGGGQAALRFHGANSGERARKAVQEWSREQLEWAPGLRLIAVHIPYEEGQLQRAFQDAHARHLLELQENNVPFGSPMGTLPIARFCPSTALAANCFHAPPEEKRGRWVNVEAAQKWLAEKQERTEDPLVQKYDFPRDLDKLGQSKGNSLIAVIHADGDGIGSEMQSVIDNGDYSGKDNDFAEALREFSQALTHLCNQAREALYEDLHQTLPSLRRQLLPDGMAFPLRPVVGAGDEVTLIVPARLGLAVATRYLELFTQKSSEAVKQYGSRQAQLSASAGVLLMPLKFPFARGYALVSQLTSAAKTARRKEGSNNGWIDFHVLHEGITGSLEAIRENYVIEGENKLLERPYSLEDFRGKFHQRWHHLRTQWSHSSAKALLEAVTRGRAAMKARLDYFGARHLNFPRNLNIPADGWADNKTPLFDPLELLDHYVPIDWQDHEVALPQPSDRQKRSQQREKRKEHGPCIAC